MAINDDPGMAKPAVGRRVVGTRLFLVSYVPLWGMFALRSSDLGVEIAFGALCVLGVLDAVRLISAGLTKAVRTIAVDEVSDKSGEVAGYLATYLLPFVGGPPTDVRMWLTYALYFTVAWAVFVPSDLGLVNPTLALLGWRIVQGRRDGRLVILLCQSPPGPTVSVKAAQLMGGIGWVIAPDRGFWARLAKRARSEI